MRSITIVGLIIMVCGFIPSSGPRTVVIPEITQVSADRYGNLYLCDTKYNITKFNPSGKEEETYSPRKFAEVTSFEAWSSINLFLFYKDFQEYVLLDRFLTEKGSSTFDQNAVGFARVATLSYDNNIWLIDDQDFSLKKYDVKYNSLLVNNPLDLVLDPETYNILSLREYQNNLYAYDENSGILIFDNLGNYKRTIKTDSISQLSFYKDSMYYLQNDSIHFEGLYLPTHETKAIPEGINPTKLLITDNGLYFFESKKMYYYKQ